MLALWWCGFNDGVMVVGARCLDGGGFFFLGFANNDVVVRHCCCLDTLKINRGRQDDR